MCLATTFLTEHNKVERKTQRYYFPFKRKQVCQLVSTSVAITGEGQQGSLSLTDQFNM